MPGRGRLGRWRIILAYAGYALLVACLSGLGVLAAGFSRPAPAPLVAPANSRPRVQVVPAGGAPITITRLEVGITIDRMAGSPPSGAFLASALDANTAYLRAGAVQPGDFIYQVTFESTAYGDDIPAGRLIASWRVGNLTRIATFGVSAACVAAGQKGGWTVVIPGGQADVPDYAEVLFEWDARPDCPVPASPSRQHLPVVPNQANGQRR